MEIYLVGGSVRDAYISFIHGGDYRPHDLDFCVVGSCPEEMIDVMGFRRVDKSEKNKVSVPVFISSIGKNEYTLARRDIKKSDGHNGFEFEFGPDVTLEEDLSRRDFTMNAMAEHWPNGVAVKDIKVIDPFGGMEDIRSKTIRHINNHFGEDPLRIFRAARFAAQLGFDVAGETINIMSNVVRSGEIDTMPKERICNEALRAMKSKYPQKFFYVLDQCGALSRYFNEVWQLKGALQEEKYHPEGDAYQHTMLCIELMAKENGATSIDVFSALCHDFGKGVVKVPGCLNYNNHDKAGLDPIEAMCERLRIPNDHRNAALLAARFHMKFWNGYEMTESKVVKMLLELDCQHHDRNLDLLCNVCKVDDSMRPANAGHYQNIAGTWSKFATYYKLCAEGMRKIDFSDMRGKRVEQIKQIVHDRRLAVVRDLKKQFWG